MAFRDKTKTALRELIESQGEDGAVQVIREGIKNKKFAPENFSIKETWMACQEAAGLSTNVHEAVASSAFPKITGELINSRIISAYETTATIGDQLVETVSSSMEMEKFAGISDAEAPEEVGEGDEYKDSTISEKYVTVQNKKFGRMISLTEEMIYFDKTGQVLARAQRIGMKAAQYKEKMIIQGVQDVNSNVYNPSGVASALFTAARGNLVASAPFGETGLEAVRKAAAVMKDDSQGTQSDMDYILVDLNNMIVLIPVDLEVEAWQMSNSMLTPESGDNASNFFRGRFTPLTSPFVTSQSSTTWYGGWPKSQFIWSEVWPLQVLAQGSGHEDSFKSDIKARFKVRFFGNVGCLDYKYWFKMTP